MQKVIRNNIRMTSVMDLYDTTICPNLMLTIAISGYYMLFEGILGSVIPAESQYEGCGKNVSVDAEA